MATFRPRIPARPLALLALVAALVLFAPGCSNDDGPATPDVTYDYPYQDPRLPVAARVADLLPRLSLVEKVGQMTQAERTAVADSLHHITTYAIGSLLSGGGSVPESNTPAGWAAMYDEFQGYALATAWGIPLIYGVDAVHGHNNLYGAVVFPHNIGLGCTNNAELVEEIGRITALEVSATGLDWTFAPCIAVPRDERWGRTYEGFGETPEINATMGAALIRGLQGDDLAAPETILACAKHFVADGGTEGGDDQGDALISEMELRDIHLPPYEAAIAEGVGSVMASYSSWNGVKVHGSEELLTDMLKTELGFDGLLLSDWAAIDQLPGDYYSDVVTAINAGIDMIMVPHEYELFTSTLIQAVNAGDVGMERIDAAVSRVLAQKFALGLFENPLSNADFIGMVGSSAHRAVARQAVRESAVLLKNEGGALPIAPTVTNIAVVGPQGDNLGAQCGGWTINWQGGLGDITIGTSIFEGLQEVAPAGTAVTYSRIGADIADADLVVLVIGENPYSEGAGDRANLIWGYWERQALEAVVASGKPFVTVLVSGRPLILGDLLDQTDALLAAWLPGTEGGGIADILFGDYTPTGTLTHSWPRDMTQVPVNVGDATYDPLFPYGYGLQDWGAVR